MGLCLAILRAKVEYTLTIAGSWKGVKLSQSTDYGLDSCDATIKKVFIRLHIKPKAYIKSIGFTRPGKHLASFWRSWRSNGGKKKVG